MQLLYGCNKEACIAQKINHVWQANRAVSRQTGQVVSKNIHAGCAQLTRARSVPMVDTVHRFVCRTRARCAVRIILSFVSPQGTNQRRREIFTCLTTKEHNALLLCQGKRVSIPNRKSSSDKLCLDQHCSFPGMWTKHSESPRVWNAPCSCKFGLAEMNIVH